MTIFKRILVALDGSKLSEQGLGLVDSLRAGVETELTLMRVVTAKDAAGADLPELLDRASSYLTDVQATRAERDVRVLVKHSDDPADAILEASEQHDLVVLMTHGRGGVTRWRLGSVAERVLRHSRVPVLLGNLKREAQPSGFQRLLVPLDGSETAAKAVDVAGRLAGALDAEVVLFRASWVDPTDNPLAYERDMEATKQHLSEQLEAQATALRNEGLRARSLVKLDYPAEAILKAVEQTESDLIVMTTHGRTGFKRWLLGSVAEKVLRASPRPVLLVRE